MRGRRGTTLHPLAFHVAGVAQTRIYLRFVWQAWRSWHGLARLGVVWARGDAAPFCVAGVAQRYIHLSFHVAGVAQTRIYLRFAWQAWHKLASTFVSRGRRGTHGMGWRAWVWVWARGDAAPFLRGRRGTTLHPPSFHVAGVAQIRIYLRFAWQAWHSWHGVARLGVVWARGGAAPFCVAGVAQPYIHLRFTWQVWHKLTSTLLSRGRRGTHGMGWRAWVWFGRAVTPRHFAWQAWQNVTSTFVSRGRRGTN